MKEVIYEPEKNFDVHEETAVSLAESLGFECPQVPLARCKQDIVDHRTQKANVQKLMAEARRAHTQFRMDQLERYGRFTKLVSAMRGVFKDDPAVMNVLAQFRRKVRRSRREENPPTPKPVESAPSRSTQAAAPAPQALASEQSIRPTATA